MINQFRRHLGVGKDESFEILSLVIPADADHERAIDAIFSEEFTLDFNGHIQLAISLIRSTVDHVDLLRIKLQELDHILFDAV